MQTWAQVLMHRCRRVGCVVSCAQVCPCSMLHCYNVTSPNQVLTHAARAARAKGSGQSNNVTVPLFRTRREKGTITWRSCKLAGLRCLVG